jgi:hypothetical protein
LECRLTAGLTRRLTRWSVVRVEYEYTIHDSNVVTVDPDAGGPLTGERPYEFDRHVLGVRMIFNF